MQHQLSYRVMEAAFAKCLLFMVRSYSHYFDQNAHFSYISPAVCTCILFLLSLVPFKHERFDESVEDARELCSHELGGFVAEETGRWVPFRRRLPEVPASVAPSSAAATPRFRDDDAGRADDDGEAADKWAVVPWGRPIEPSNDAVEWPDIAVDRMDSTPATLVEAESGADDGLTPDE